jgi:hypothetical protein
MKKSFALCVAFGLTPFGPSPAGVAFYRAERDGRGVEYLREGDVPKGQTDANRQAPTLWRPTVIGLGRDCELRRASRGSAPLFTITCGS